MMMILSLKLVLLTSINRDLNCSNISIKTIFIDDIDPTSIAPEKWCSVNVGSCIDHQRYFLPLQTDHNKDKVIKFSNDNISVYNYWSLFLFLIEIKNNNTQQNISDCFLSIESLLKFNDASNASRINDNVEYIQPISNRLKILQRLKRNDESNEEDTNLSLIMPLILLGPLLIGLIMLILYSYVENISTIEPEPEVQENMILCMEENALYHYKLIFRVGCPDDNFDMKRSFVDFEILGFNDEIIGAPIR